MESKFQRRYIDHGFGFPVLLSGVELVKVRGQWTPRVNYNTLRAEVLWRLAGLNGRLTGNQVRFIRRHHVMTLQQFGNRFGVSHPAVIKWERRGDDPTGMSWSTEKDIRLFIGHHLEEPAEQFKSLYIQLEAAAPDRAGKVSLEFEPLAA